MRKGLFLAVVVMGLSFAALAQSGLRIRTRSPLELFTEQRNVVGTWCRQDFQGQRLSADGWRQFKAITTFQQNPDFSGIVIVSRYAIPQRETPSWDIDVNYWTIGRFDFTSGYSPAQSSQTVTFKTKDVEGDLMVTEISSTTPFVSKSAAITWMKQKLDDAKSSDVEKYYIREALKVLEAPPKAQ